MGYEVDFFPVVTGGAAVTVRWGTPGRYKVMVYDGGTRASGERVVEHLRAHCKIQRVDYLVSSHPDPHHAEGLACVLERLTVGELWMHRPWTRTEHGPGWKAAHRVEQLALDKGIPIHEPFAGAAIGPFTVLSPQRQWYLESLLPAFSAVPSLHGLTRWVRYAVAALGRPWELEPLPRAQVPVRAQDQSSAVLYGEFEGRGVMLTGDAGMEALEEACSFAEQLGFRIPLNLRLLQVPHQGRPEHLSSALLDRIVGGRQPQEQRLRAKSAFISVARHAPPSSYRVVTDALKRRGALSFATEEVQLQHSHEMPERGWRQAGAVDRL
ncbi:MAG: hypothetical protein WKG52_12440 [Variovorax sp.]